MSNRNELAFTPEYVESLEDGQVFVFGSNLVGCHSGGAAAVAMQRFGAVWGQAEGPQGRCYAIPVDIRGEAVGNVSDYLKRHVDKFLDYAKSHREHVFLVLRIGCGAAGFDDVFMATFFKDALDMDNVILPRSFVKALKRDDKKEQANGIQRVYNLIIIDESGSMTAIAKQAVSGLNETFQTICNAQKEHREQQHYITLVTFNSARIWTILKRMPVQEDKVLKWTDYRPSDCTPLFDAMGRSLNELKNHVEDDDVVLVTIITDGYENASREYSGRQIKNLVAELKARGWVFAYIGTNQDVDAVADDLGIRSRMSYEYSDTGACEMFEKERRSKDVFFSRLSREGRMFMRKDDYDYFEEEQETPGKEAEITGNADIETHSTDNGQETHGNEQSESTPEQDATYGNANQETAGDNIGLWGKIKNYIKG